MIYPFWEKIKFILRTRKITQGDFAQSIGVSAGTFKYWMCYGVSPDLDTAIQIADKLGVSLEFLARGPVISAVENRIGIIRKNESSVRKIRRMTFENAGMTG